ncbi:hypothetical protein Pan216_05940 [Planctomycetes bacterium Pan216]|uniref:HEAT repeat protein n=1 Tax=Kolteria novifilia TaxID=2527975 RepID=A0A518AYF9_9BACT|nr:hypothetical protein Pan216_05940 [Planctomycetes bacterium Pan216]
MRIRYGFLLLGFLGCSDSTPPPAPTAVEAEVQTDLSRDQLMQLVKGLDSSRASVRLQSATTLGRLGAQARPFAERLKEIAERDKDKRVREAASQAIAKISPPSTEETTP